MKKAVIIISIIALITLPFFGKESFDSVLKKGVQALEKKVDGTMVVCFGNFTYSDQKIGTGFSVYLENNLGLLLDESSKFELFAKSELESIMETIDLSMDDLFDEDSCIETGNLQGIQGLITGTFFENRNNIDVYINLINVEKGLVIAKTKVIIKKKLIPSSVSIIPLNYETAVTVKDNLQEVTQQTSEKFEIRLWTTRGDGAVYHGGENLIINILSELPCYVKVYHIDVNNKMQLIFPNIYYTNNKIDGQVKYTIPDDTYPFQFALTEPYGTEFIKIVAQTVNFGDMEEAFADLGESDEKIVQRGLSVKSSVKTAENIISYTITLPRLQ